VAEGTLESGFRRDFEVCLEDGAYTFFVTSGSAPSDITWVLNGTASGALTGGAPAEVALALSTPTPAPTAPSAFVALETALLTSQDDLTVAAFVAFSACKVVVVVLQLISADFRAHRSRSSVASTWSTATSASPAAPSSTVATVWSRPCSQSTGRTSRSRT